MFTSKNKIALITGFAILCLIFQPAAFASSIDATLDVPFDLKVGETASMDSVFQVTFLNVTEDSRCPADVICIWQGTVSVEVNITKDGQDFGNQILTLGESDSLALQTFDGNFVRLTKVEPYPFSSQQIQPSEYVVTMFVSRVEDVEPVGSPLQQFKSGISVNEIQCKENLQLIIKSSDGSPACVKPKTIEKLVARGWALDESSIDSFEECAAAGNPVMESYPRQCRTSDGKNFVEEIDSRMMSPESLCQKYGGNWLQEFNECEMISSEQCSIMNGTFKECESACRHMPDAEVCILMCVPVCVVP